MTENAEKDVAPVKKTNERLAWPILFIVWFAGICAPANMAKVTTLAPVLMEVFGISESSIGWVIALFYVLGVICAFPASSMCKKFGLKAIIVASLVFGIAGGLIGALSSSLALFMVSRVLEGLGMGVMGVAGVAAIAPWFPNSKKGLPLAIWSLWVSVATIIFPVIYSWLTEATGTWRTSWWLMIVVSCIALVLVCAFYRSPNFIYDEDENLVPIDELPEKPEEEEEKSNLRIAMKVPAFWVIVVVMIIDGIGFMAMNGFITTYLTDPAGANAPLTTASFFVSLGAIIGAVVAPISGTISDKLHSRKIVLLVGLVIAIIFMWVVFDCHDINMYYIIEILCGLYCGSVSAMTWVMIGDAIPDEAMSGGSAGGAFAQNLGFFIGAAGFGYLLEAMGSYAAAMHFIIVPLYVIGAIVVLVAWKKLP